MSLTHSSIEVANWQALRTRTYSGTLLVSYPSKPTIVVSTTTIPPPVTQKSVMLATQPGLVCITMRYPSLGVMSRMTFMNWPFQNSVNDWWPMTMRPSVVAEPMAMNAEQWLLRLPFGASLTYWLATVDHQ